MLHGINLNAVVTFILGLAGRYITAGPILDAGQDVPLPSEVIGSHGGKPLYLKSSLSMTP